MQESRVPQDDAQANGNVQSNRVSRTQATPGSRRIGKFSTAPREDAVNPATLSLRVIALLVLGLFAPWLTTLKARGYDVHLVFLWLSTHGIGSRRAWRSNASHLEGTTSRPRLFAADTGSGLRNFFDVVPALRVNVARS